MGLEGINRIKVIMRVLPIVSKNRIIYIMKIKMREELITIRRKWKNSLTTNINNKHIVIKIVIKIIVRTKNLSSSYKIKEYSGIKNMLTLILWQILIKIN